MNGISFSFESGQIFGFVGPNGAGKSTTMRILATLDEPTGGDATVDGVSVVEEPEKAHRLVGYVPDALPDHRDISVHEYLDFFARAYGISGEKRRQVVEEIEEFTNLAGHSREAPQRPVQGHEEPRQRGPRPGPRPARADHGRAGRGPRSARRIELRELLKVLAGQGKAILISSHILTELAEICTGAVFIERGKILRAGTLEQLLEEDVPQRTVIIRAAGPAGGAAQAPADPAGRRGGRVWIRPSRWTWPATRRSAVDAGRPDSGQATASSSSARAGPTSNRSS